ncbi:MAG: ATP-binding protein [Chloroflexota bacterium]
MGEMKWRSKWNHDEIRAILLEQFQSFWRHDLGITRHKLIDLEKAKDSPYAVIVSGLRRVGKSTLLAQFAHRIGEKQFYYLNFQDDRFLNFEIDDFNDLFQYLVELFGDRPVFIIDEIQTIRGWERFVRRFMDLGYKFYISGSNASLLSGELGTLLTGRYLTVELLPFSFREFLSIKGIEIPPLDRLTTVDQGRLQDAFLTYVRSGGIPDALKYPELPVLETLFDDVLYRDIVTRYRIESVHVLRELAFTMMSNPATKVSYSKLQKQFFLGSINTIKNYFQYLENSWLFFTVNFYDYSIKRQQISPKKVFTIDTGMANKVGFSFSPNTGKYIENIVYLTLRQKDKSIFYWTSVKDHEIDFYLPSRQYVVQVTYQWDAKTQLRELRAIQEAIHALPVKKALILSDRNEDGIKIESVPVAIRSVAQWLLDDENNK